MSDGGNTGDTDDAWYDDVLGALASGRKIEAIRLYREATGTGLAEAKAAVEALGVDTPVPAVARSASSIGPAPNASQLEAIMAAIASNRKIQAIKSYREATGASLIDAKHAVEAFERSAPIPPPSQTRSVSTASRGPMMVTLIAIVVAVVAGMLVPLILHAAR